MSRVDQASRPRTSLSDDEEPTLADEASPTLEGDPDLEPDPAVDALLHDEAQHAAPDLDEIAPDPAAEDDLLDAAPAGPDDPDEELPPPPLCAPSPRAQPPAQPPSERAFTGAWREPVLPPRRVARRSARDELMADLGAQPAPATSSLQIKVSPRPDGDGGAAQQAPAGLAGPPDGDVLDVLPPEVRIKVLEARSRRDESMAAAIAREARRTRTIAIGMALVGLATGAVSGSLCLPTTAAAVAAALADGALLGVAGFVTHRGGGGMVRGLGAFGAAAIVSACVKVRLGAIGLQGVTDVDSFALLVGLTLAATLLGGFVGQRIDQRVFEDGT